VRQDYPETIGADGTIDGQRLLELPEADRRALGEVLFQYHCNDCHAAQRGYSAVAPLVRGWTHDMIHDLILDLHQAPFFMPPWCGTEAEAQLIADYLKSIAPKRPGGMLPMAAGRWPPG